MIEKLSKYKDLGIEISTIWGLKTETVSVVIGALEQVKKGLGKYVEKIPGNTNIEELQEISLLYTAHILRKVLSTNEIMTPPPPPPSPSRSQGNWLLLGALDSTNSERRKRKQ